LPQRRKPSQRRSQERVELILRSTAEILRTQGIAAVTTNSIASQAGIPVSSIYQYFSDKVSILAALYQDYLAAIEQLMDEFDTPEKLALSWKQYFTELIRAIYRQEVHDQIDKELDVGMALFPELMEIELAHRKKIANRLAKVLQHFGSRWSIAKLERLSLFYYEINSSVWGYRSQFDPVDDELLEWETAAMLAVVGRCMES